MRTRLWGWLLVRRYAFMCWYEGQAMRMASCLYICVYVLIWGPGYENDFLSLCLHVCVDMGPGYEDGFLSVYLRLCVDMVIRLYGWHLVRISAFMCLYEGQAMRTASCLCICVYVLIWGPGYEDGFLSVYLRLCVDMVTRLWGWLLIRISAFMCWYGDQAGYEDGFLSVDLRLCVDMRSTPMMMASCPYICVYVLIWGPGYEDGFLSVYLRLCVDMLTRLWGWDLVSVSAFLCWYEGQAMRMASCPYVCFYVLIWWPGRLWRWLIVRISAIMCWFEGQALRMAS